MHSTLSTRRVCVSLVSLVLLGVAFIGRAQAESAKRKGHHPMTMQHGDSHAKRAVWLEAGPLRVKFQDGELRYLYVGGKEVARRVYFAVRDKNWDTPPPQFSNVNIQQQANGFTIDLAATCKSSLADYSWRGRIVGTPDGKLTFHAEGAANQVFQSQRIGLCLLYGAESLAGQAFQTTETNGQTLSGNFPALVSPTLVASNFTALQYTTQAGMKVTGQMDGTHFDMEDQRNYGDSSYKAYAPLAYNYPNIKAGETAKQTFTLSIVNAPAPSAPSHTPRIRVTLGQPVAGSSVPTLVPVTGAMQDSLFINVNTNRSPYTTAKTITWGYNPSVHLPDSDNFLDNTTTARDQVKTSLSFAPNAVVTVAPIRLPLNDARRGTPFAAAWTARLIKYLSGGHVANAAFDVGTGYPDTVQTLFAPYAGKPLYAMTIEADGYAPLDAYAVQSDGGPVVWLINLTDQPAQALIAGLPSDNPGSLRHINDQTPAGQTPPLAATKPLNKTLSVDLRPYEVCQILVTP